MPRVVGVDIPANKRILYSLRYVHGIGSQVAARVLKIVNIDPHKKAGELTEEEVSHINSVIEKNFVVEGQLRRQVRENIDRLKNIGCYRGIRHRRSLPCRGQRTRTNARTRKGPRRTVAGKKSIKQMR
jgi:small subunit ribosomal protein S13